MEATGTTTTRTAPSSPRSPRTESPVLHQSMTTASQSSQQASGGGGGGGDRSPDSVYKFAVPGFEQPGNSKVVPTDPAVHLSNNQPMSSSLAYSEDTDRDGFGEGDSDTYLALQSLDGDNDGFSVQTGQYANRRASSHGASHGTSHANNNDATQAIHEMHLALLYLLSNPEEFQAALPPTSGDALAAWNAECEAESTASASVYTAENRNNNDHPATTQRPSSVPHPPPPHSPAAPYVSGAANSNDTNHFHPTTPTATTPLPFAVFADDAEVVLPQAHTVSQLFGVEVLEGIELEAASGVPSISQLFLRWLALMPGGDHLNLIDPPGLTVMRIAGGRYRVTAAHRVVWTWNNAIAGNPLQPGDLVTMTIVDVFETDSQGKLLSYCPTFDNRAIHKTNSTTETLRKSSTRLVSALQHQSKVGRLWVHKASHLAQSVQRQIRNGRSDSHSSSHSAAQSSSLTMSPGQQQQRNSHAHAHELALDVPDDIDRHEV